MNSGSTGAAPPAALAVRGRRHQRRPFHRGRVRRRRTGKQRGRPDAGPAGTPRRAARVGATSYTEGFSSTRPRRATPDARDHEDRVVGVPQRRRRTGGPGQTTGPLSAPLETVVRDQDHRILVERAGLEVAADPAVDDLEVGAARRPHRRRRWRRRSRGSAAACTGPAGGRWCRCPRGRPSSDPVFRRPGPDPLPGRCGWR